jgi:deaminated glutathione amidase
MKITVIQMEPGPRKDENIAQAGRLIQRAVTEDSPRLVVLPETWSCLGGDPGTRLAQGEVLADSAVLGEAQRAQVKDIHLQSAAYDFLQRIAREHKIYLHGGSIGERVGDHLFNTTLVFSPEGREIARYRKIHLFNADTADGSGYCESAEYGAGESIVTYKADDLIAGCAICYDLRFPELFLALRRAGAEVIVLPAAFTLQTGRDHWEPLLRARAIETQCWIAASATWGAHTEAGHSRATFGHSLICDPWGHIVSSVSDGTGWATNYIDRRLTAQIRARMPILSHRAAWETPAT